MRLNSKVTLYLRIGFLLAVGATAGSLFFSEVLKLPPCVLCWYQRICMYPLVLIFGLALFKETKDSFKYAFALASVGLFIAIYHNLLYYGFIPDSITPCTQGVSCTSKQIEWLGFITIPLLSLISFLFVSLLCMLSLKEEKHYEKQ